MQKLLVAIDRFIAHFPTLHVFQMNPHVASRYEPAMLADAGVYEYRCTTHTAVQRQIASCRVLKSGFRRVEESVTILTLL